MGRRAAGVLATAAGVVLMATSAGAATQKLELTGHVKLDRSADVRAVVTTRNGKPHAVKGFRLYDVKTDCGDGVQRIDLKLTGKALIEPQSRLFEAEFGSRDEVRVTGVVDHRGHRVRFSIEGKKIDVEGIGRCKVPSVAAVARG